MWWCYDCTSQIRIRIWPNFFGVLPIISFIFTLRRTLYLVELCKHNKFKAHKTCPELSTARTWQLARSCFFVDYLQALSKQSWNAAQVASILQTWTELCKLRYKKRKQTYRLCAVCLHDAKRQTSCFCCFPATKSETTNDLFVFDTENCESKLAATKLSDPVVFVKILSSKIRIR